MSVDSWVTRNPIGLEFGVFVLVLVLTLSLIPDSVFFISLFLIFGSLFFFSSS